METVELVKRAIADDTLETETGRTPVRLPGVRAPGMHEHLSAEARRHPHQLTASGEVPGDLVGYDQGGQRLAWVECEGRSVNSEMKEHLAANGH